ncbi:MAG: hypothetical protein DRP78_06095, partial [Candidatus Omnitrophota bacterium]
MLVSAFKKRDTLSDAELKKMNIGRFAPGILFTINKNRIFYIYSIDEKQLPDFIQNAPKISFAGYEISVVSDQVILEQEY